MNLRMNWKMNEHGQFVVGLEEGWFLQQVVK